METKKEELEGRMRGGTYRDVEVGRRRQSLVVARRKSGIVGHGWSEGEGARSLASKYVRLVFTLRLCFTPLWGFF